MSYNFIDKGKNSTTVLNAKVLKDQKKKEKREREQFKKVLILIVLSPLLKNIRFLLNLNFCKFLCSNM